MASPLGGAWVFSEARKVLKRPKRVPGDVPSPPASHHEALARQLDARWGSRADRDHQAQFPLVDARHWERVHYRSFEHLTAFRYGGDGSDLIVTAFALRTAEVPTSASCLREFEKAALPQLEPFDVRWADAREVDQKWRKRELAVHQADGEVKVLFSSYRFSAAWTAYPAYREGCLVVATVVLWDGGSEIAKHVRDRWVEEGFRRFAPRTKELPFRRSKEP